MMKKILLTCIAVACSLVAVAGELLIEAESFSQRGGWVLDQQFMDQMGSPYLMAHGMGIPVADATAEINIPQAGTYYFSRREGLSSRVTMVMLLAPLASI